MYKVIKYFTDLKDGYHAYNVGDTYPRDGAKTTDARIAELAGCANRQGVPLIAKVVESLNSALPAQQEETPVEQGPSSEVKKTRRGRKKNI